MTSRALPPEAGVKPILVPSLLSADLLELGKHISAVKSAGAKWLHIDVMDGHFVPNISFGPSLVKAVSSAGGVVADAHLMVSNPADFVAPFAKAGADVLTVHAETAHALKTAESIKKSGIRAGISVKPDTDLAVLKDFLPIVDLVLVMTVFPGFGGQGFLDGSFERIKAVREMINKSGRPIWLQVDGGINGDTIGKAVSAGADNLVAGYAIFGGGANPADAYTDLTHKMKR